MEKTSAFDLPEDSTVEIVNKIEALADMIRSDWTDPRGEIRAIKSLCEKLRNNL